MQLKCRPVKTPSYRLFTWFYVQRQCHVLSMLSDCSGNVLKKKKKAYRFSDLTKSRLFKVLRHFADVISVGRCSRQLYDLDLLWRSQESLKLPQKVVFLLVWVHADWAFVDVSWAFPGLDVKIRSLTWPWAVFKVKGEFLSCNRNFVFFHFACMLTEHLHLSVGGLYSALTHRPTSTKWSVMSRSTRKASREITAPSLENMWVILLLWLCRLFFPPSFAKA